MGAGRWPFRRALRQKRTNPCVHPTPWPGPALETCRRPSLPPNPEWSGWVSGSGFRRLGGFCCTGAYFRQPEVQNLGVPAAPGYENVGGLDVAVDDSFRVRRVQRIRDLDGQCEQRFQVEGAVADQVL